MVIDGFMLFGNWPGLPMTHPVEHLIEGLQRFKLDRACAISSQSIFFDATVGNELTLTQCRRDARLVPIGTADPRVGGVDQVDYCVRQGFKLMALFPIMQQWSIENLSARGVLNRIAESNLPVLIEASREGDASRILAATAGLTMPIILLDVSLRTLTEAVYLLRARPKTYLSTRLLCGADTIESLAKSVGADRLIFTSQYPISCYSSAFMTAKYANVADAERLAIMGENMAGLLASERVASGDR